jgi:excisionase family DNA binding protein
MSTQSPIEIFDYMEAHMERLHSIEEAAELLRVKPVTVRSWVYKGWLVPVRLGSRVLLTEKELERFIEEGMRKAKHARRQRRD